MHQNQRRPRLLAVAHEGSQTGAPMVLALLLQWLHDHTDVDIHTLLVHDGALRPAFEAVGTVSTVDDLPGSSILELLERGLVHRGSSRAWRAPAAARYEPALRRLGTFDLVYLNSLTTLELLPHLRGNPTVIAHMHETDVAIDCWPHAEDLPTWSRAPRRWIAVSEESGAAVTRLEGVDPESVVVLPPFIDVGRIQASAPDHLLRAELRRGLGIPRTAQVVVGSGTIDWRKGPDLFVQLATEVRRRSPEGARPVHFVWVGGKLDGVDWVRVRSDLRQSGADHVHFTGHQADPRPWFHLADVFALTSREDPFPLVCLEHAALGTPVTAYSSSGIGALLRQAGAESARGVIPYLDVGAMAERIIDLLDDPTHRAQVGADLRALVTDRYDVASVAPAIASELGLPVAR